MKKLLCVLCLLLALVCIFAACDTKETPNADSNNNDKTQHEQGGEETPTPAPHTHTWGAWETITAATCGTAGQQKRVCACGESETQSIPATGSCVYNTQNICTVCGVALQYTEGLAYTINSDGESYTVTKGTALNNTTDIVIPWYHEGKPVTSIGSHAFYDCDTLASITIPASVTSIGDWAFSGCDSLTSIKIPASVTSIGSYAFDCCTSLTSVTFGENSLLTGIGNRAFYDCDSLTSIDIPTSVTSIGNRAFYDCDSLTSVTFGENSQLTSIGDGAFYSCNSLTSITIPASVTSIGNYAFDSCDSLTSVTFGENSRLTSIGTLAFSGCSSLTSITIPASVTSIGREAFYHCNSLTSVTFENTTGWWVSTSFTATSGTSVDVSVPTNNDDLLTVTYDDYFWKRTVT